MHKTILLQVLLFFIDLRIKIFIKYKNLTIQTLKSASYALNWILQGQSLSYG